VSTETTTIRSAGSVEHHDVTRSHNDTRDHVKSREDGTATPPVHSLITPLTWADSDNAAVQLIPGHIEIPAEATTAIAKQRCRRATRTRHVREKGQVGKAVRDAAAQEIAPKNKPPAAAAQ
jgi:hypothetical protein